MSIRSDSQMYTSISYCCSLNKLLKPHLLNIHIILVTKCPSMKTIGLNGKGPPGQLLQGTINNTSCVVLFKVGLRI